MQLVDIAFLDGLFISLTARFVCFLCMSESLYMDRVCAGVGTGITSS